MLPEKTAAVGVAMVGSSHVYDLSAVRKGGKKREREGGREGGRDRGREGRREGGREGMKEGGREGGR